jgi:hypothetical protein
MPRLYANRKNATTAKVLAPVPNKARDANEHRGNQPAHTNRRRRCEGPAQRGSEALDSFWRFSVQLGPRKRADAIAARYGCALK